MYPQSLQKGTELCFKIILSCEAIYVVSLFPFIEDVRLIMCACAKFFDATPTFMTMPTDQRELHVLPTRHESTSILCAKANVKC